MNRTSISWADMVWNPITGCTPVSAGCANCYAAAVAKRFWGDRKFSDVQLHRDRLRQPYRIYKPKRIFVNSMSDLFHEALSDEDIAAVFREMENVWWHNYIVLTKRPERVRDFMKSYRSELLGHVWIGVSVENQETAEERLSVLLNIRPYRFRSIVSVEPMLGPIDLTFWLDSPNLRWVICGAESGPNRRPFQTEWAADLYRQCKTADVPFFGKQDSGARPGEPLLINGQTVREFPEKLRS